MWCRPVDVKPSPLPGNHSPEFAPVPEPTIRTGTVAMSLVLLDVLQKK
jgi:hippurate hydrolase